MKSEDVYILEYKDYFGDKTLIAVHRSLESAKEHAEMDWEYNFRRGKRDDEARAAAGFKDNDRYHDKIEWDPYPPVAWYGEMYPDKPEIQWVIRKTILIG